MKRILLLVFFGILFSASSSYSQYVKEEGDSTKVEENDKKEEEKANKKDKRENPLKKISIGGNFGFWMYQGGGSLYLAPKIGYQVKPWFRPGINLTYQYRWGNYGSTKWQDHVYGGGLFVHFILLKRILLMAEWEVLSTMVQPGGLAEPFRKPVNMLFIGAGYNQPMGKVGYFSMSLLYDVLNNPYSPYRSQYIFRNGVTPIPLIIRIGVGFGL
jgi:hypothetical protein